MYTIAVLSDTHIPDRARQIPPVFLEAVKMEAVDLIVHTGDICTQKVLDELKEIAPVMAVRGNRDFLLRKSVPKIQTFERNGIRFAIMHGHINFWIYWFDKFEYIFQGYRKVRYLNRLEKVVKNANVYIYGHTHHAENCWKNGILFFNPGSVTIGDFPKFRCSWGLIRLGDDGTIEAKIKPLP